MKPACVAVFVFAVVVPTLFSNPGSPADPSYGNPQELPDGYRDARILVGYWDYVALVEESVDPGSKIIVACRVAKVAFGTTWCGILADTDDAQSTPVFVLFPSLIDFAIGDMLLVYGRFKCWYPYRDGFAPVFEGDGWHHPQKGYAEANAHIDT